MALDMTVRQAAAAYGVKPSEWSAIEHGRGTQEQIVAAYAWLSTIEEVSR